MQGLRLGHSQECRTVFHPSGATVLCNQDPQEFSFVACLSSCRNSQDVCLHSRTFCLPCLNSSARTLALLGLLLVVTTG
jgi:hypothetical protein